MKRMIISLVLILSAVGVCVGQGDTWFGGGGISATGVNNALEKDIPNYNNNRSVPAITTYPNQQQYLKRVLYSNQADVMAANKYTGTNARGDIYKSDDYGSTWALYGNLCQVGETRGTGAVGIGNWGTILQTGTAIIVDSDKHIFRSRSVNLAAAAAVDSGGGTVSVTTGSAHGMSVGQYVVLVGSTNYEETSYLLAAGTSGSTLVLTATYGAETFAISDEAVVFEETKTMNFTIQQSTDICETDAGYILVAEYETGSAEDFTIWISVDDGLTFSASLVADNAAWGATANDPAHWHYVQWDRYADKVVAFCDLPNPRIYTGIESGGEVVWSLLHTNAVGEPIPDSVTLCFDENHIGWFSDHGERHGKVRRISRTNFYAANFTASTIETVAELDETYWGYPGYQLDDDVWLVAINVRNDSANVVGSHLCDSYILYDDCSKVSPGIRWSSESITFSDTDGAGFQLFPSQGFEADLDGRGWVWLPSRLDAFYTVLSVPISLSFSGSPVPLSAVPIGPFVIQEDLSLVGGPSDDQYSWYEYNTAGDYFQFYKSNASVGSRQVFYDTGLISLQNGNTQYVTFDPTNKVLKMASVALTQKSGTFTVNDVTPSVSGANIWVTGLNNQATAITDLDGTYPYGQVLYIVGGSSDTASTIADSGNFNLSASWTANPDDILILWVQSDNDYIELGRVDN